MAEERSELVEYLAVLWRWKWLVVAGTLAAVLAVALISLAMPKVYRVEATIETGDFHEKMLNQVKRLVTRVNAGVILADGPGTPGLPSGGLRARFREPSFIDLTLETRAPAEGVQVLERTATRILNELDRLRREDRRTEEEQLNLINAKIDKLRAEIEFREQRIAELKRTIDFLQGARNRTLSQVNDLARILDVVQLLNAIDSRKAELHRLEFEISVDSLEIKQLEREAGASKAKLDAAHGAALLVAPTLPRSPVRPRLVGNLAVGFVVGLVGSVFVAFFADWVQQARRRSSHRETGERREPWRSETPRP